MFELFVSSNQPLLHFTFSTQFILKNNHWIDLISYKTNSFINLADKNYVYKNSL